MHWVFPVSYKIEVDDYILMRAVVSMHEKNNSSETLLQSYPNQIKYMKTILEK